MIKAYDNEVFEIDDRANKTVINLLKNNKSKNLKHILNIKAIKKSIFLTFNAKKIFNNLKQAFIKVLILQYFNLKSYILNKTDVLDYAINGVLSQLNLDFDIISNDLNLNKSDFGQWHLVAHFFK